MPSTEVEVDPAAFDLPGGAGAPAAVLCLHGLTGTPWEVRALGEALSGAGLRAVGPVLPGHGETPDRLHGISYQAWVEAARDASRTLRERHTRVFCVGQSMGGLVTLLLAAEGVCDAAVCIGVPLRLRQPGASLIGLFKHVVRALPKRGGSDIRDAAARARHPSYDVMPLTAVHELQKLQARVRAALPQVGVPLLVAHGALDRTAHPDDAHEILARVASRERRHLVLERSGHVVPVDHDGPRLTREVVAFLTALDRAERRSEGPAGPPRGALTGPSDAS